MTRLPILAARKHSHWRLRGGGLAGRRRTLVILSIMAMLALAWGAAGPTLAQEPHWIWTPAHTHPEAPPSTCYFRRTFAMIDPEAGEIQITADDSYELFVNGKPLGTGTNWRQMDRRDLGKLLVAGTNTIAVKVNNAEKGAAGLLAVVHIKERGGTFVSVSTDETWKSSLKELPHWNKPGFDDSQWLAAAQLGQMGDTQPWGTEVKLAGNPGGRFQVPDEFKVEWLIEPRDTGSLIAMTFNEFGQVIASREGGPLLLIYDKNRDGLLESVATYCDQVKNCQGLLCLNGNVYVTGEGPQGPALYKLSDANRDGRAETVTTLLKFTGEAGEHAAHAVQLGPDGLLYVIVGNHAQVDKAAEKSSPYRDYYEGDIAGPRFEDPSGHATGIKAPGGTVFRTDTKGSFVELVSGGLRNAYDTAFNREGDLVTFDSDMEWDEGLPWHRPTRITQLVPGGEYGWRSGWAKWPEYYHDSLPAALDAGPGSPTGMTFYNHVMFPVRYQNALFACDWALGRIQVVKMKREGGALSAEASTFLEGRPMNVTDIEVGPDGWLYFCTGGRGTEGGIYRVVWTGKVPPQVTNLGEGLTAAIRQPQLASAWSRQKLAAIKQQLGTKWDEGLPRIASEVRNPAEYRTRALDLMQLFGPFPGAELLLTLSGDRTPEVRAKAAYLMGIHADAKTGARLVQLLADPDLTVRRLACESLVRAGQRPAPDKVLPLLANDDRFVAYAARRLLERIPVDQWRNTVLKSDNPRVFIQGATALMTANPTADNGRAVIGRTGQLLHEFISDPDFVDLMRVVQLAIARGELGDEDLASFRRQLSEEYPTSNTTMNRELVRLLVAMGDTNALPRMLAQLKADAPDVEKVHLAMHLALVKEGLTSTDKMALLKYYETARAIKGGNNVAGYVESAARTFFATLSEDERRLVLLDGAEHPRAALSVLATLPADPSKEILTQLVALDRELTGTDDEATKKLQVGIVAVLGRSRDPQAMAYLRELFESQPQRRVMLAIGLAQDPGGENWPLLVRSLPIIEGTAATLVLKQLATVDRTPAGDDTGNALRNTILTGLKLGDKAQPALDLLAHWSDDPPQTDAEETAGQLSTWQSWFAKKYPDLPPAELPVDSDQAKWTYRELLSHLESSAARQADPQRGHAAFVKAQCAKCHRFGDEGETIGPDLTNVARRFQKKEILESIVFPSQVISDQYAGKTVVTVDGTAYSGIVAPSGPDAIVVLQPTGEKATLRRDEIEQIVPSRTSAMPEGLLNTLTLAEIADLFAYLQQTPGQNLTARPREPAK